MRRLLCGLLLIAVTLTGCSGNDDEPAKKKPQASGTPTTVLGAGSDIENDVAARADVQTTQCKSAGKGSWQVVAKATNSTDKPVHYELALRFASAKDGSVLARKALKTKTVAPGKAVNVTATAKLEAKVSKVNCVFVAIDRIDS